MYKLLIFCVFLCGCCSSPPIIKFENSREIKENIKQNEVLKAWEDIQKEKIIKDNKKIIDFINNIPLYNWKFNKNKTIALLDLMETREFASSQLSIVFFKVSVFEDGTLFLDETERQISPALKITLMEIFKLINIYNSIGDNDH